eukprot:scaffold2768_cov161-Amphora_coffeaeformis.AAC.11
MCNKVVHCLLGGGISNISLSDVELVDSQESVDYQLFMCGNYRELHRIELSLVGISALNMELLQQTIANRALGLQEFIMHDNDHIVPLDWVDQLAESIGRSTAKKIKLPGRDIMSPRAGISLCYLPGCMAGLRDLVISDMVFLDDAALALSNAISLSSALRVLALQDCSIDVDGSHALSRCLASNPCLERLIVTGLFNGLPSECKQTFFEMLATNDVLKMLDISKNEFTRNEFFTLAQSLSSGSTLEEIRYKEWSGNGSGFLVLGRALFSNENESMVELNVDGRFCSSIRSEANLVDCQVFGNALQENKILQKLYVVGCQLGDAGCAVLLSGLGQNRVLKEIALGGNSFGDEACSVLATILRENETLEVFTVSSCVASAYALIEVVDALRTNRGLRYFHLEPQHIEEYTQELGREVLSMLQGNYSLEYFFLPCPLADFRRHCTFYLRLNHLGREELVQRSSTGESRELAFEALLKCSNDLDCISYILRVTAPALF